MMSKITIKAASLEDFQIAVDWAKEEGWNPGIDDLTVFHSTDPNGFLIAKIEDQIVASISVVKYNNSFGFLGFYIVHPEYRGNGIGMVLWNKGIDYLGDATIGLDGVVDQQENYKTSGFKLSHRNIRFSGIYKSPLKNDASISIREVVQSDIKWISKFDGDCFGCNRSKFITKWIEPNDSDRRTLVAVSSEGYLGFGTIRKCVSGNKIGPLFVKNANAAHDLLSALCASLPAGSEITIDVPDQNEQAAALTKSVGLKPVFETARMYRGKPPSINWQNVFGITSFELG